RIYGLHTPHEPNALPAQVEHLALRSEARRRAASFHRSGIPSPTLGEAGPVLQLCCSWAENRRYGAVLGGPPRIRNEVSQGVCGHLRTARQGVRFPPGAPLLCLRTYRTPVSRHGGRFECPAAG